VRKRARPEPNRSKLVRFFKYVFEDKLNAAVRVFYISNIRQGADCNNLLRVKFLNDLFKLNCFKAT
jgi:hypothetical protein